MIAQCKIGETTKAQFNAYWQGQERLTPKKPRGQTYDLIRGERYQADGYLSETIWIGYYPDPLSDAVRVMAVTFQNGILESIYSP